mmetsp:Transcript_58362/g.114773  ORF Transcript_58362/g.114773 Transcript_58362/m.114773 type:complete len:396 (-) Transcript_58362:190-1377(-)
MMISWTASRLCFLVVFMCVKYSIQMDPWNLPVLPESPPSSQLGKPTEDKLIPRHLWIAVRNSSDPLNYQMPALFERNSNWEVHVCSNEVKDEFMNKVFAGTSFLWAYHIISPAAGAAKADLWRYAVLWAYGGAYIDDDSDMHSPLDKVVGPEDTFIVSYEKNGFNGNRCYVPRYHLSDFSAYRDATLRQHNIFHGRILLNWAMLSAPRHPILEAVMKNAVEIITHEYHRDSVMRSLNAAFRWEAIMCATGPSLLTASAREVALKELPKVSYKLAHTDFKDFGGRFKAVSTPVKNDPKHYMNTMNKLELLSSYLPEPPIDEAFLKRWQGHAIMGQNGKEIFVIDQGKRRGIPNFDTFMALNFTMADVLVVSDQRVNSMKLGSLMPPLDYTGSYPIH